MDSGRSHSGSKSKHKQAKAHNVIERSHGPISFSHLAHVIERDRFSIFFPSSREKFDWSISS